MLISGLKLLMLILALMLMLIDLKTEVIRLQRKFENGVDEKDCKRVKNKMNDYCNLDQETK